MECPDYPQGLGRFDYVEHTDACYIVHVAAFGTHREAVFVAEGSMDDRPTAGDPEEDSSTG